MTEYVLYEEPEPELQIEELVKLVPQRTVMKQVDSDLNYWGYTYYSEVLAVIKRTSGINSVMGKMLKKNIKPDYVNEPAIIFTDTSDRFHRVNSAVSRMPLAAKLFIHRHYAINEERKDYRNGMKANKYAEKIGVEIGTYNKQLRRAKQLLRDRGILTIQERVG